MRRREYWLVTTHHLLEGLLFKDSEDYVVGMNLVAALSFKCNVTVLAFVLMSNHVHLVLECTRARAVLFVNFFKREYSRHLNHRYGVFEVLRRNKVDIKSVLEADEVLERAIAYVQMNPVAANVCAAPQDYPWGTGRAFFAVPPGVDWSMSGNTESVAHASGAANRSSIGPVGAERSSSPTIDDYRRTSTVGTSLTAYTERSSLPNVRDNLNSSPFSRAGCRLLGELSGKARSRLMHTKADLPGGWIVCPDGYVLPESYVDVESVERIFKYPKRMNFFLNTSSKARQRLERAEGGTPSFRDDVLVAAIPDLCRALFGKRSVEELVPQETVELLHQLRRRFSAGVSQIARVVGLNLEQTVKYLDSI
ncbi:MAG: transposase [Bacteroidales bacterium]|nr:transposase [Bacteroidales bacterium]